MAVRSNPAFPRAGQQSNPAEAPQRRFLKNSTSLDREQALWRGSVALLRPLVEQRTDKMKTTRLKAATRLDLCLTEVGDNGGVH